MKPRVLVADQNASEEVLHLDASRFDVVVTARGDNGQPVTFEPGQVSVKLGKEDQGNRPSAASRQAEFPSLELKRSSKLTVAVDGEVVSEVVLLTRRAGWLSIFALGTSLTLAMGLVVFQLAFMRFDNILERLEESSARVIEFMFGGFAVVLGASVVRESVVGRSSIPLLRRRRYILPLAAFVVVLMLFPVRSATYAEGTAGGALTLNGVPAWQPGNLRFLIGDDKKVAPPLCLVGEGDSSCRAFGRRHLYEAILARNQIGCSAWWPNPGPDVNESPSESCTRVTLVRGHPDGRSDKVTMDYETRASAADASAKVDIGPRRIAIVRDARGAGNSTTSLPGDVEIKSNIPVEVDLRPEDASKALAARVVLAVDAGVARGIDGALLGGRFTAIIRAPGSEKEYGRFSYSGLAEDGAGRDPSGDEGARGSVQLEVRHDRARGCARGAHGLGGRRSRRRVDGERRRAGGGVGNLDRDRRTGPGSTSSSGSPPAGSGQIPSLEPRAARRRPRGDRRECEGDVDRDRPGAQGLPAAKDARAPGAPRRDGAEVPGAQRRRLCGGEGRRDEGRLERPRGRRVGRDWPVALDAVTCFLGRQQAARVPRLDGRVREPRRQQHRGRDLLVSLSPSASSIATRS